MRILPMVLGVTLLGVTPSLAYDNSLSVQGIFSEEAYGGSRRLPEAIVEEEEARIAPAPKPAVRPSQSPPARSVDVAALIPPLPEHKPIPKPVLATGPLPPDDGVDAKAQNILIEKSLIARAFEIRRSEGKSTWKCLHRTAKEMLSHIEAQFGKVQLISTCRPGAVIATSGLPSQHGNGRAIDFEPGKKHTKKDVVKWLIAHKRDGWVNGIMTYVNYSHIHVDTGNYRFVSLGARG